MASRQDKIENFEMKGVHSILPARLDWPSAIGLFLLNFGTLEYFAFVFLKDRLKTVEFLEVRKKPPLKNRLDKIAEHMRNSNFPLDQQTAFSCLVVRVNPLRELRNHIAHGHLLLCVDPNTGRPTITLLKAKDVDMAYSSESKKGIASVESTKP